MASLKQYMFSFAVCVLLPLSSAYAEVKCDHHCFEDFRTCRDKTDAFLISGHECSQEQIACRMSCNSGRKLKEYRDLGEFHYSFRPMLENML